MPVVFDLDDAAACAVASRAARIDQQKVSSLLQIRFVRVPEQENVVLNGIQRFNYFILSPVHVHALVVGKG